MSPLITELITFKQYLPGTRGSFEIFTHLILTITLWDRYYCYPNFTYEKTEKQMDKDTCHRHIGLGKQGKAEISASSSTGRSTYSVK